MMPRHLEATVDMRLLRTRLSDKVTRWILDCTSKGLGIEQGSKN